MSKQQTAPVEIEIDGEYESRVDYLAELPVMETAITPAHPVKPEPLRAQPPAAWVPGQTAQPGTEIQLGFSQAEAAFMQQAHQAAGAVLNAPRRERDHSGHTRQTDTAMSVAQASRYYAWQYIYVAAGAMFGLLFLVWLLAGGNLGLYVASYIFGLAAVGMLALYGNRKQGLRHSATGIAHHQLDNEKAEIEGRNATALAIVDKHLALLEKKLNAEVELKRLGVDSGRNSNR